MFHNKNLLNLIGMGASLLTGALMIIGSVVSRQQMEITVEEKVNEAIANQNKAEES